MLTYLFKVGEVFRSDAGIDFERNDALLRTVNFVLNGAKCYFHTCRLIN